MNKFYYIFIISLILTFTNDQYAKEIIIFADSVSYDSEKNIIAKGNAKVISEDEIIFSDLIIYNQNELKYILPKNFNFKDNKNNFYDGSSGEFSKDLSEAIIKNPKVSLNDGSRIVGVELRRKGFIDIITKGAFSPCTSKIKIGNFICPVWQIEDEKLLHDREKLFLYHKHSKIRVLNLPVYYAPYLVSPSPLRKKRKSGFLNPNLSLFFIDGQTSQSVATPYYFALDIDKELLFTPTINYGGGVDSSQRFLFDYNQLISGGKFNTDLSFDTKIENENNETWYQDAWISSNYQKNLNEKFKLNISSTFQSSPTYLKRTAPKNILNQDLSLSSSIYLNGYNLRKFDDELNFQIVGYQVVKKDDDNGTSPTALPYIKYNSGYNNFRNIEYNNRTSFYNIVRDKNTDLLSKRQQKISNNLNTNYEIYKLNSKINFRSEFLFQGYHTENKKIGTQNYSGYYTRFFPMNGIYINTPINNYKYNFNIEPSISFVLNGLQTNSDKISNEESINSSYSLLNNTSLNRYTGSDKLDNSQRINYSLKLIKNKFTSMVSQSYEFNEFSNYNVDAGLKDSLSDVLSLVQYDGNKNSLIYKNRINVDIGEIAEQSATFSNINKIGGASIKYSQQRIENNSILNAGTETLDINLNTNNFYKYNKLTFNSNYDLINDYATKYSATYNYLDECFGIDLSFNRSNYEDRDLKPTDSLIILFKFKYLGSYGSTNLAVSELEKQNIDWNTGSVDDSKFIVINND